MKHCQQCRIRPASEGYHRWGLYQINEGHYLSVPCVRVAIRRGDTKNTELIYFKEQFIFNSNCVIRSKLLLNKFKHHEEFNMLWFFSDENYFVHNKKWTEGMRGVCAPAPLKSPLTYTVRISSPAIVFWAREQWHGLYHTSFSHRALKSMPTLTLKPLGIVVKPRIVEVAWGWGGHTCASKTLVPLTQPARLKNECFTIVLSLTYSTPALLIKTLWTISSLRGRPWNILTISRTHWRLLPGTPCLTRI